MEDAALKVLYFERDLKKNLSDRLKRIEGQVRGLNRMVQADEACPAVLLQVAATQAALRTVGTTVLRNYLENCVTAALVSGDAQRKEAVIDDLMEVLKKYGR